jgi:hypothetical protein
MIDAECRQDAKSLIGRIVLSTQFQRGVGQAVSPVFLTIDRLSRGRQGYGGGVID